MKLFRLSSAVLTLLALGMGVPKQEMNGGHRKVFASTFSFNQYTFVADSPSNVTSITSPSITLPSSANVLVFCRSDDSSAGHHITVTSTPSGTFTQLTLNDNATAGNSEASYSLGMSAGSTTFTCTFISNVGFTSMIVSVWTGGAGTFDTQAAATTTTGTPTATGITTAQAKEVVFLCGTINSVSNTWAAGSIGGHTPTLSGVSASALTSAADAGCEYYVTSAALASGSASINTTDSSGVGTGTVAAFK